MGVPTTTSLASTPESVTTLTGYNSILEMTNAIISDIVLLPVQLLV